MGGSSLGLRPVACGLALPVLLAALVGCGGGGAAGGHSAARTPVRDVPGGETVQYLPGGLRTIATHSLPGVGRVSIVTKRYRFQGHVYLDLDFKIEERGGATSESGVRVQGTGPLSWTFGGYCAHAGANAWVVAAGLLRDPRDSALLYTHGRPHRLQGAPIPAYLHAKGVAVYAVLDEPPERILVRTPRGRTVMSEDFGRQHRAHCSQSSSMSYAFTRI